ncbi:MAG TPA: hypothetical protein VNL94_06365 [Candidatus Binatia bacterium]|nr:hypothetical protein [Candidatus Binatia bacterium]
MSKRHNVSRRRSYGRRQHELHERMERRADRRAERDWRLGHDLSGDALAFDSGAGEHAFGFAD